LARTALALGLVLVSCVLPEAVKVDDEAGLGGAVSSTGGKGNTGGKGSGVCSAAGIWPDSTPSCSNGAQPPCPLDGEDGSIYAPAPSYTVDAGHVTDELTGLVWEQDATVINPMWSVATNYCDDLSLDGLNGWHLPLWPELLSIADYGRSPALAEAFSQETASFWTLSATDAGNPVVISFDSGALSSVQMFEVANMSARCVRGTLAPANLTLTAGGIITDSRTQLEWRVMASPTPLPWLEALDFCASLGDCWRLATVKELITIFDPSSAYHLFATFPSTEPRGEYWSSTPFLTDNTQSWTVDFSPDDVVRTKGEDRLLPFFARCVRGAMTE
jgi:hypothetical protein